MLTATQTVLSIFALEAVRMSGEQQLPAESGFGFLVFSTPTVCMSLSPSLRVQYTKEIKWQGIII